MEPLVGPGGRYRARLELLQEAGAETLLRKRTSEGRRQSNEWLVLIDEVATARLTLGEGGITLHTLGLAQGGRAILQAEIEPSAGAPDWLSAGGTLRLFEGDRQDAAALRDRFVPLPGAVGPPAVGAPGAQSLDQLFVAVGRSVARANRALVDLQSPGGTALVTTVTVNVSLDSLAVERGRVVVKPASGAPPTVTVGGGASGQSAPAPGAPATGAPATGALTAAPPGAYVQFTMALAPSAPADPPPNELPTSVSSGPLPASQSKIAVPPRRK